MNKNCSVRNRPMLPSSVAQSQNVGKYIAQLEGTKSRCRLVTTITNRSTHMPRFTDKATKKRATVFVRTFCDQSNCGTTQFSAIKPQKTHPYEPNARWCIIALSKTSPL